MGSFLVGASLRAVYEPEDTPEAPAPLPLPTAVPSHMNEPPPPMATRRQAFDLLLLKGNGAETLFPAGTIDPLTFVQRSVTAEHHLEYVIRADPESAEVRGHGVFRLDGDGEALVNVAQQGDLWQRLRERHGIVSLPPALEVIAQTAQTYDRSSIDWTGRNVLKARYGHSYRAAGQRPLSHWRILEVLRESCRPRQLIAWIESAISRPLPGTRQHRYYQDAHHNLYLVRAEGAQRRLFMLTRCRADEVPVPALPVPEVGTSLGAVFARQPRLHRARPRSGGKVVGFESLRV